MKKYNIPLLFTSLLIFAYSSRAQSNFALYKAVSSLPHLYGKAANAGYLYTTAGDQLYAIGNQAGNFPSVGFHVPGEMGGIWQQPIKLFDGFRLKIQDASNTTTLTACDSFVTYPFTSSFIYSLPQQQLSVTRTQFVPDGKPVLVVEYAFTNLSNTDKNIHVELLGDVNLRPVWLGERTGMNDTTDELLNYQPSTHTLLLKDKANSWYAGVSLSNPSTTFTGIEPTAYPGKGITGKLSATIAIQKGKTALLYVYFSGSTKTATEVENNIYHTADAFKSLFYEKKDRYRQLTAHAAIDVPDAGIMQAYKWGKYSSDWLARDVAPFGRAMSAGLPDYPWFFSNDQATTFNALVGTIQPELFYSSWKMLKQLSAKANGGAGRIIHEASTNGSVYDKGRMEESQLHIITAWNIFRWTGNLDFLKENYAFGKKTWDWLQTHDTDHNGYIEGYGGVEIEGLNAEMLDVQVHTQSFLQAMSEMATVLGDKESANNFIAKAAALKTKINADWWVPGENRYADFISSPEKAIGIIDTALSKRVHADRNSWARQKLEGLKKQVQDNSYPNKGYVVYYNASGTLPVDEGIADTAKALQALQHINWFTNKYGLYIAGIERPDDLSADEGNFKHDADFNYNRAVMPAATTGIISGACRYGSTDTALQYMHILLNSFSYATPGTLYEVSPDYGMFVQAWNITGLNIPLLQYFFGIDPQAYEKKITLRPNFPTAWKKASVKKVIIGNNLLSIQYNKNASAYSYHISLAKPGWQVKLVLPAAKQVWLNGKPVKTDKGTIVVSGTDNSIRLAL